MMGPNEKALREKFDLISQEIAGARTLLKWIRTERVNAPTVAHKPYNELRRAVLACMLWEDSFYETGESIADRYGRHHDDCPGSSPHLDCVCGWSRVKRDIFDGE